MFDYFFIQQFYNNVLCGTTRKKILGEVFCLHSCSERMLRNCCGRWKTKNGKDGKSTSLLNFRPLLIYHSFKWRLIEKEKWREISFNVMHRGSGWFNGAFRWKMTDFLPEGLIKKFLIIHHTPKSITKTIKRANLLHDASFCFRKKKRLLMR